ncbi:MAG: Ig-like domain-containing protein [Methylococcales bacterium]|nr:Ig-like domain-containing protein [Methylococcales bacterium]
MKTKHTLRETASFPLSNKNKLRQFIRLALVGSMLTSGVASAILQDHGPSDPTLIWPQWYRDGNNLAVGLCKSQVKSPNAAAGLAPMCFAPLPDAAGFAGNIGPEMFYNMVHFKARFTPGGFGFRYVAGLEASYLPLGVPIHGTETVFARVRIALNFNTTAMNGTYTVTHPFGKQVFNNVQATNNQNLFGANAAVFFTADVPLAVTNNFDLALGGAIGPFIQWDVLNPGESLTVPDPNPALPPITFLGDPSYAHTFTGSPFGTNFLKIDGPTGSNIGGPGIDSITVSDANVLGQVWSAPIAQPLAINGAYETRATNGLNSIDVWATSSPNQKLILTGVDMPSLQMLPSGSFPGLYHGHIEYNSPKVPANVTVTNLSSNPVTSTNAALTDGVEISQATFDTPTRVITIVAHSTDQVDPVTLIAEGIPGVPTAAGVTPAVSDIMTKAACPAGVGTGVGDVCYTYTLPTTIEPPESVSVASSDLGSHADHLVSIVGAAQNLLNPPVATDFLVPGFTVSSSGSTQLLLADGITTLPLDAVIIQQPTNGAITLAAGVWSFTATAGTLPCLATAGATLPCSDSFKYVKQTAGTVAFSNVATANLTLAFKAAAPTAVANQFAASTADAAPGHVLPILSNDLPASTNAADALNPTSVTIVPNTGPTKGTLVKNANGSVTYKATSGGADSFSYTVKSAAGIVSNTATVTLTNFTGTESVSVGKVTYGIGTGKWVVVGGTNWFGPNLTTLTATCWMGTGATSTSTTLIGSAPIDTTGKFQIAPVGAAPVGINNGSVTCQTSSLGKGVGTTVAK